MELFKRDVTDYIEELKDIIGDGNLLFITENGTRYLVDPEGTNNKYATIQNCTDGEVSRFHIECETEELFGEAECYTDVSMTIRV